MRDAGRAVAKASGDAARDVAREFGPLPREPVKRGRRQLEQQAVAHRPDAGGACAARQHADLPDRLAWIDFGDEPFFALARRLVEPHLHAATREQEEAVRGVALAEQPVAAATDAGLELVEHQRRFLARDREILLQRREKRRSSG